MTGVLGHTFWGACCSAPVSSVTECTWKPETPEREREREGERGGRRGGGGEGEWGGERRKERNANF